MEYYLAIKRNESLTHATTQMNLEDMLLNERSQTLRGQMYDSIYRKCLEEANL